MARVTDTRPYVANRSVWERALPSSARFFVALARPLQAQVSRVLCHAMSKRRDAAGMRLREARNATNTSRKDPRLFETQRDFQAHFGVQSISVCIYGLLSC